MQPLHLTYCLRLLLEIQKIQDIFGAGAVGGVLAGRMIRGGSAVTIVARGAHLKAIQKEGLKIYDRDGEWKVKVKSTDDTQSLGQQDLLILGVKAHTLKPALTQIEPLIGTSTTVMHITNGIPWWFFHGIKSNLTAEYLDNNDSASTSNNEILFFYLAKI